MPMLAPMLDARGQPLTSKNDADAEGLRIVSRNGRETAYVSFEQTAGGRPLHGRAGFRLAPGATICRCRNS